MLEEFIASQSEVIRAIVSGCSPCVVGVPATRPKHIAIRAMLWDGGYGKTSLLESHLLVLPEERGRELCGRAA